MPAWHETLESMSVWFWVGENIIIESRLSMEVSIPMGSMWCQFLSAILVIYFVDDTKSHKRKDFSPLLKTIQIIAYA